MEYKIFCCTHVKTTVVDSSIYVPLQTGRRFDRKIIDGIIGDDTGENISEKKDVFDGYLTGMYWVWKNQECDVKGICNYRSYLSLDGKSPCNKRDVEWLFEESNIDIVVTKYDLFQSVEEEFVQEYRKYYYEFLHDPIQYLREVVEYYSPDYVDGLETCLQGTVINNRHTIIAKKRYFDSYCEWIFGLLFEYIKYLEMRKYVIQPRMLGYLVERLERVFLLYQECNIKELPLVYVNKRNNNNSMIGI